MEGQARVLKEFKELSQNPILNISAQVGLFDQNNPMVWRCSLSGPANTPYAGGLFYLKITFTEEYPNKAPEICFLTPIYHLNINPYPPKESAKESLGHVCISSLNWWKKEYKMKKILADIFALFYENNVKSPYGLDRAEEFNTNKRLFDEKCRYFTKKYAALNREEKNYDYWDFTYPPNQ